MTTTRLLFVLTIVGCQVGCASELPTAPTGSMSRGTTPALSLEEPGIAPPGVAPDTVTLAGVVRSTAGGGALLSGATIVALDGPNQGRAAVTDVAGNYSLPGLIPANTNFSATVIGHTEYRTGLFVDGVTPLDFSLTPNLVEIRQSINGSISAADLPCESIGLHNGQPCKRHLFTLINDPGQVNVFLYWPTTFFRINLNLEIWQANRRLASTSGSVLNFEEMRLNLRGGPYEIRVIFAEGGTTTPQPYVLTIHRPL